MGERLLVTEFSTGGGLLTAPLPEELQHEGDAMLAALLADLAVLGRYRLTTTRDLRLPPLACAAEVIPVAADVERVWERCCDQVDAVWWIAPETGGHLQRLHELALARGKPVLGCAPEAVALTGDKLALAETLTRCALPTIPGCRLGSGVPSSRTGWVVKPVDGAGCQQTWRCRDRSALDTLSRSLRGAEASYIVQSYCPGEPVSLSLICANGSVEVIACNQQIIAVEDDCFLYQGSVVNAYPELCAEFRPLAERLVASIPGLWGYVGVDLIRAEQGPVIVEINPRLTTSYVGLGQAVGYNPAEKILRLPAADWWPQRPAPTPLIGLRA